MSSIPTCVCLTQIQGYHFNIKFGVPTSALLAEEPPPLGHSLGPSPTQSLLAAVSNCMSASLLFTLRKFKQNPEPLRAEVSRDTTRRSGPRACHFGALITCISVGERRILSVWSVCSRNLKILAPTGKVQGISLLRTVFDIAWGRS